MSQLSIETRYYKLNGVRKLLQIKRHFVVDCNSSFPFNFSSHLFVRRFFDCLRFFFLLSLLTTKVHNYSLFIYYLFGSGKGYQTQEP